MENGHILKSQRKYAGIVYRLKLAECVNMNIFLVVSYTFGHIENRHSAEA